jgi:hypothetical protein
LVVYHGDNKVIQLLGGYPTRLILPINVRDIGDTLISQVLEDKKEIKEIKGFVIKSIKELPY